MSFEQSLETLRELYRKKMRELPALERKAGLIPTKENLAAYYRAEGALEGLKALESKLETLRNDNQWFKDRPDGV